MASGSKDSKISDLPRGLIDRKGAPTGKATRLPSLRGPRDLTLGGVPKKVFAPIIPIRKEKSKDETLNDQSDGKANGKKGRERSERGRGRGAGRGRGQDNLIQMHSLFEQGPSGHPYSKGWGGCHEEGGGGGGGRGREKSTYAPKIKQENPKSSDHLDSILRDDFLADGPEEDPTMVPIMLPLAGAVMSDTQQKTMVNQITVKKEKEDTPEDTLNTDEFKSPLSITKHVLEVGKDVDELSCKRLLIQAQKSDTEELVFLQLPDVLPGLPARETELLNTSDRGSGDTKKDEKKSEELSQNLTKCSLADFTEGYVGKLLIRKSGKTELILGNNTLDVSMGTPFGFLQAENCVAQEVRMSWQDVVSVRTDEDHQCLTVLGHLKHRLICTPNFESLLNAKFNT